MSAERPLHVRVAEALGCKPMYDSEESLLGAPPGWYCRCAAQCPAQWRPPVGFVAGGPIALYDTDGRATVPLMERYVGEMYDVHEQPVKWVVNDKQADEQATGLTPLIAVCNLILALAKAGKLPVEP